MRVIKQFIIVNMFLLSFGISNDDPQVIINVLEQSKTHIILEYVIEDFNLNEIHVKNEVFHDIDLNDEPDFLTKYSPKLPHINRSLIIPDISSINASIISSEYQEYEDINIVPSKGNPTRNIDLNTIPYSKGAIYNLDDNFPGNIVQLDEPYILRDYRAQVLQVNPFQYNPVSKVLQVYSHLIIEIDFNGQNYINAFNRNDRGTDKLVKDYYYLYSDRFLNYDSYETRYNPIDEDGEMLVICYDDFCDDMDPFVSWKNQKGIKTTLVPKSQAGTTANSIKSYVEDFYNSHNLTYLLLVGDKSQIPTFEVGSGWSDGESDISYAYISGNDSYPEFFVGRFSASNSSHVNTQVERTIEYERYPQLNANWYTKGLMIASNEGAGSGHDGGESDWQHARNMRDDLLDYYYNDIDEMYDGSHNGEDSSGNPSDTMVRNAINDGLGIIHYTGHGDTDVWVTTNFNNSDVNALTNSNELPFICTVGCKSGDFGGTCLGESFLRSTNGTEPTGAIATFMSTVYQAWAPPMEAQDEMVDILTESFENNRKYSFGGISWNGCLEMNDNYGSDGDDETDHWTLFGDPSVELRTNAPSSITISHSGAINPEEGAYEVVVNGNYDNVLGALSYNGSYLCSAYANNGSIILVPEEDISNYNEITLTVTGYNTTTLVESISVGSSCPGYISGDMDGNSILNIQDIILLINIVLDVATPNECQVEFGDLNNDGISNVLDVILLVNRILEN